MNTGTLEVRYDDYLFEIRPDWFTIYSEYHGVREMIKYQCETKDAYPRNMLEFIESDKDNNIIIENPDCWLRFLTFDDEEVNDHLQCLLAAYSEGWIEEYLKGFGVLLKCLKHIDAKYIE